MVLLNLMKIYIFEISLVIAIYISIICHSSVIIILSNQPFFKLITAQTALSGTVCSFIQDCFVLRFSGSASTASH